MSQPRSVGKEGGGKNNVIDISYILSEEVIRNDHRNQRYVCTKSRLLCRVCKCKLLLYKCKTIIQEKKEGERKKWGSRFKR